MNDASVTYVLNCLDCQPPEPVEFATKDERELWSAAHEIYTAHKRFTVWEKEATDQARTAPVFICPQCRQAQTNPEDVEEGYCEPCNTYTGGDELQRFVVTLSPEAHLALSDYAREQGVEPADAARRILVMQLGSWR